MTRGEALGLLYLSAPSLGQLSKAKPRLAVTVAEQIREGVKHLSVQHRRQPLGAITLSLGAACFPEHGLTGAAVIKAADAALYLANKEGCDRCCVAQ